MEPILEAYRRAMLNWLSGSNYSIAKERYEPSGTPNYPGKFEFEVTFVGSMARRLQFASLTVGPYIGARVTVSAYLAIGLGKANSSSSLAISEAERKCKNAGIDLAFIYYTGEDFERTSLAMEIYRNEGTENPTAFFNDVVDTLDKASDIIEEAKRRGCE